MNKLIYERVNNGVYLAGFATRQRPYEIAARKLFETLDELDTRLRSHRYLMFAYFYQAAHTVLHIVDVTR